jgi:hypothetical protein
MIELSLSAFAWAGVVLFQAIVHYTVRTQKRKMGRGDCGDPQPALEASPLVLELAFTPEQIGKEGGARDHCPRTHAVAAAASHVVSDELFQDEIDPLDGDEPPVFFELLSQTGCEMMRVRVF